MLWIFICIKVFNCVISLFSYVFFRRYVQFDFCLIDIILYIYKVVAELLTVMFSLNKPVYLHQMKIYRFTFNYPVVLLFILIFFLYSHSVCHFLLINKPLMLLHAMVIYLVVLMYSLYLHF